MGEGNGCDCNRESVSTGIREANKAALKVPQSMRFALSEAGRHIVDRRWILGHFSIVKSLLEIEEAISRLPVEARQQLVRDLPALCPDAFPADGWEAILKDP